MQIADYGETVNSLHFTIVAVRQLFNFDNTAWETNNRLVSSDFIVTVTVRQLISLNRQWAKHIDIKVHAIISF